MLKRWRVFCLLLFSYFLFLLFFFSLYFFHLIPSSSLHLHLFLPINQCVTGEHKDVFIPVPFLFLFLFFSFSLFPIYWWVKIGKKKKKRQMKRNQLFFHSLSLYFFLSFSSFFNFSLFLFLSLSKKCAINRDDQQQQ